MSIIYSDRVVDRDGTVWDYHHSWGGYRAISLDPNKMVTHGIDTIRKQYGPVRVIEPSDDPSDCVCVWDCGECSLSGDPHVHPDDGRGLYGPCPVHPDAPGDL